MVTALGLKVLRIFLHSLAFEHLGAALHTEYLLRFIAIAEANGAYLLPLSAGVGLSWVYFGSILRELQEVTPGGVNNT